MPSLSKIYGTCPICKGLMTKHSSHRNKKGRVQRCWDCWKKELEERSKHGR